MEIYFLLLLIVLLLLIFSSDNKNDFNYKIIFIILALFSGLRYDVGIDFPNYERFYDYVDNSIILTKEPGFGYVIFWLKKWLVNPQYFFILFACLTQYFYFKIITSFSKNIKVSILLYLCVVSFYLYSLNAVRQTLAVSVFLYCIPLMIKSKFKGYIVLTLATTFFVHLSMIFFIPLFFLVRKKINFFLTLIMFMLSLVAGLSVNKLISYTGYAGYLEKGDLFQTEITLGIYVFLLLAFLIEVTRNKITETKEERVLLNLNLIGACILLVLIMQTNSAIILSLKRIHNYILASYILLIPVLINKMNFEFKSRVFIYFFLSVILVAMYSTYVIKYGDKMKLIPYQTNLPF